MFSGDLLVLFCHVKIFITTVNSLNSLNSKRKLNRLIFWLNTVLSGPVISLPERTENVNLLHENIVEIVP